MYFVDRSKIEETLSYTDRLLQTFDEKSVFHSSSDKLALERIVHMTIESMLDVGNMMIDGFIMRDPGSYEDIIDILIDEKVLPSEDEDSYKKVIKLRTIIVQQYLEIEHKVLEKTLIEALDVLKKFSYHVTNYLDNELDVAHAFSNE